MTVTYVATHEYQYAGGNSLVTRRSGCTWTGGSIGADASTGGRIDPTPDEVHAKVARWEESNPDKPGWTLDDLKLAMDRLGVPFVVRTGKGWAGVRAARKAGLYVVVQGDSDRFPDGCSGAFDGDHLIGIPPAATNSAGEWAINDPICPTTTYEPEATLRAYAEKFDPGVSFGVFTTPVPVRDTEDDDMGLTYRCLEPAVGTVTVVGDGHAIIAVDDGGQYAVPDGQVRESFVLVELVKPLDDHPGDRQRAFLIGKTPEELVNKRAAVILASDVVFTPAPPDCTDLEAKLALMKSQALDYQRRIHEIRDKVDALAADVADD